MSDTYFTPPQIGERYRVSPEKVIAWIKRGELRAVNVAAGLSGRPRFRIALADILAFEQRRSATPVTQTKRRAKQAREVVRYF